MMGEEASPPPAAGRLINKERGCCFRNSLFLFPVRQFRRPITSSRMFLPVQPGVAETVTPLAEQSVT